MTVLGRTVNATSFTFCRSRDCMIGLAASRVGVPATFHEGEIRWCGGIGRAPCVDS
jgi:hypothetical protein